MSRSHLATLLVCAALIGCDAQPNPSTADSQATSPAPATAPNNDEEEEASDATVAEVYSDLRSQVLQLQSESIGRADLDPTAVFAVLMETGTPDLVVSLVAVADGTASLYFSNGGGVLGSGEHQPVRRVCDEFITLAQQSLSLSILTETTPLPGAGDVRFYFVTGEGIYTFEAAHEDLERKQHPGHGLFYKAHELFSAIRRHTTQ